MAASTKLRFKDKASFSFIKQPALKRKAMADEQRQKLSTPSPVKHG
jgi:hypothetical protein